MVDQGFLGAFAARVALLLVLGVCAAVLPACGREGEGGERGLRGVVRDTDGTPLPAVWLAIDGHRDRAGLQRWTRTDHAGRFEIASPPQGDIDLRVVTGVARLSAGTVQRIRSGTTDVVIELPPMPMVTARILDYVPPEGDPRHARLTWVDPDGRRVTRHTPIGRDGSLRFVDVPVDTAFELWALAAPERPVRNSGLRAGKGATEVSAVKGERITGRIVLEPGDTESLKRVSVWAHVYPDFEAGRVTLENDGAFVISNLPPGTYVVGAAFTMGAVSDSKEQQVESGATGVELDLRE